MEIIFPRKAAIANANTIIEVCNSACRIADKFTLSLKDSKWFDPFAVTILAGTLLKCLRPNDPLIKYISPDENKLENYLTQIGFYAFFNMSREEVHKSATAELKQLKTLEPIYIDDLANLIDIKMQISSGVKDSIRLSLSEILTNVFDHSNSDLGCFICAQYYPTQRIIRLCITDFGSGILYNLRDKYALSNNIEAIKLSVKEGITSRPQTAGFGLYHISRFLRLNEGTLTIISGNGKVNFYSNKIESYEMQNSFDGTIVNLKINADKESLYFLADEKDYII